MRLAKTLTAIAATLAASMTFAQSYPNKPIKLIVPFPPGDPTVRAKFAELGADPISGPPEEVTQLMASDIKKWTAIIKKGGIALDKQ